MTIPVGDFAPACPAWTDCNTAICRLVRRRSKFARVIHRLGIFAGLFARHKIESVRKLTQHMYAVPGDRLQGNCHVCKVALGDPADFRSPFLMEFAWPIFSFNAPVTVCQSQPGSRASGFCSKAFLASLYRCAAPPAVRCTNGCRRTHGCARCYPRRLGGRSAVLKLHLRMFHRGMVGTRSATEGNRLSELVKINAFRAIARTCSRLRLTAGRRCGRTLS